MRSVVFVAPFLAETTVRFVSAVSRVEDARTTLVSQDPPAKLPDAVRGRLHRTVRVPDALDPDALAETVRTVGSVTGGSVDRLLGTLEELQVPLGHVRDRLGIEGMGADVAENFRDKSRMKGLLRAHGLPCARHVLADDPEKATAFVQAVGYPVIVKPQAGSGSRGTHRLSGDEDLATALRSMPPTPRRPLMLEEFVQGEEHSFDSVALGGRIVWSSINDYLPPALEVLREPWIQWSVLLPREVDDPRYDAVKQVAGDALRALGMQTGMSHMEWFRRPDGSVAISEVGARPPGARFVHLISWAHDFDLFRAWADLMVHHRFEPRPRPYAAGAAYLRGQGRGRVARIRGLREVLSELGPMVVESRMPEIGQVPSGTYEGEGYVIVRHPETAMVRQALDRIVSTVRVDLEPS
ncbi:MAG: ATP-grasp domain-containing protein [Longimicrobiales bacterium]|nr:ATP-grasp domain-containing protein [Longimicrobiales bacterium]